MTSSVDEPDVDRATTTAPVCDAGAVNVAVNAPVGVKVTAGPDTCDHVTDATPDAVNVTVTNGDTA